MNGADMNQKNSRYQALKQAGSVVYPILVYLLATTLAVSVLGILVSELAGIRAREEYQKYDMMIQTIGAAAVIPVIFCFYKKDKKQPTLFYQHLTEKLQRKSRKNRLVNVLLMFFAGAAAGIAMNHIIAMTAVKQISENFQEVTENFFAGGALFETAGAGFIIPILEELLFRGVVYGRLRDFVIWEETGKGQRKQKVSAKNCLSAMLISSLIFGAMHGNLVQFIYAAVLGMMLAWFVEEAGHIYGAMAAHMGANLMAVLRMETDWLLLPEVGRTGFLTAAFGFTAISILLLMVIWLYNADRKENAPQRRHTLRSGDKS